MAISPQQYQKLPTESIDQYTARIASLRSADMATGPTRSLTLGAGDPASIQRQGADQASSVAGSTPTSDPNQVFGQAVMGLLTQYQKLGTAPFVKQGLDAQSAQAQAVLNPNLQGFQGASPAQQQTAISAGASPFDAVISASQQGAQTFQQQLNSFGNILQEVQGYQQQVTQNAEQKFKDLVTNFGGEGLQTWAMQNPDQATQLEKILGYGKGSLAKLGASIKDRELQVKQDAHMLAMEQAATLQESRKALAASRTASAVNSIIKTLYPSTQANPINTYAAASNAIARIDPALQQSTDPKNPNKAASDLDLVDAYIQIARGGGQITEAQVDTLLRGLGIKAKFDIATQKIVGTGILDDGTRRSIAHLAKNIFASQQKNAQRAVEQINKRLLKQGFSQDNLLADPLDAASFQDQSGTAQTIRVKRKSDGVSGTIPANEFDPSLYDQL